MARRLFEGVLVVLVVLAFFMLPGRLTRVPSQVAVTPRPTADIDMPVIPDEIPAPSRDLGDQAFQWNQLLSRDAIAPIYDPEFVPAGEAPYDDGELVIGVEINGEAKAYAIGPLNRREMVNDTVGGVPVLVTW